MLSFKIYKVTNPVEPVPFLSNSSTNGRLKFNSSWPSVQGEVAFQTAS